MEPAKVKRFDSINVIPFIDIMLVLLAIVLTTSTFVTQRNLAIDLPEATAPSTSLPPDSIELAIDAQQTIYFENTALEIKALEQRLAKLDRETTIVLRVDKQVPFQRFISVIDLLKRHQLNALSIVTRQ